MTRVLRLAGWLMVAGGVVIALYLVYSLYYTGVATEAAQRDLLERWERDVGGVVEPMAAGDRSATTESPAAEPSAQPSDPPSATPAPEPAAEPAPGPPPAPGEAVAVLAFARPGDDEPLVVPDPLFVVEGVSVEELKRGPGHYTGTAMPGQAGNFAVAGHRTTYGHPFFDLDELRAGDEVHVTDRGGRRWVYSVVRQEIVDPADVRVIAPDPLGTGRPTLTLTTCHPRFSAAQRLVVFAELAGTVPA